VKIPLSAPDITDAEIEAVTAVLRTPVLSRGRHLVEFEAALAARVGAPHAVGVSSGTAALHLAIRACGISAGDEVITTPFSFIATANALLYERAQPVFVDIDPVTLNIDPDRIEAAITPRTRAILVVHVFGRPAPMERILDIARRHSLLVIEDACEALGAEIAGRAAGTLGACGVFSFYPNKQMTTGEGGMIVTADPRIAALCRSLRNHGRDDEADGMTYHRLGYNYRLGELASALGVVQLGRLAAILSRRQAVAEAYRARLAGHVDLAGPPPDAPGSRTSWFVYVVRLSDAFNRGDRDAIAAGLAREGIGCGRYFPPLHLQEHIAGATGKKKGDFPHTEAAADRTLALPFSDGISDVEIDGVCEALLRLTAQRRAYSASQ
jgi:perosamine synthetase